jgi:hypothetical protein
MLISGRATHRFLIRDHDSIYTAALDRTVAAMGHTVLRTPLRSPQANAFCERVIGTIRRECLDWMIPLNERHLRRILREWVAHYNRGRPHASLGPGIPDGPDTAAARAGLGRVTWHQFRHIHSSLLNDLKVPAKIAQEQLGHASISTTLNIYTHVVDASHRKAVEDVEERLFGDLARSGPKSAAALENTPPVTTSVN